jgi:hypothetical protein
VDSHHSNTLPRRSADATRFNAADKVTWAGNICSVGIMSHDRQLMQSLHIASRTDRPESINGPINPRRQTLRMQGTTHLRRNAIRFCSLRSTARKRLHGGATKDRSYGLATDYPMRSTIIGLICKPQHGHDGRDRW